MNAALYSQCDILKNEMETEVRAAALLGGKIKYSKEITLLDWLK